MLSTLAIKSNTMFLTELYKSADDARRWLSTLLRHCLCHLFQDQIRQISPALISFLIIQHYSARCVRWSSGRRNIAGLWQSVLALQHNAHSDTKAAIGRPIWQICNVTLRCTYRYIWSALGDWFDWYGATVAGKGNGRSREKRRGKDSYGHKLWASFPLCLSATNTEKLSAINGNSTWRTCHAD